MDPIPFPTDWLLHSDEPWVRFRTRSDFLGEAVERERTEVLRHPAVRAILEEAARWPGNSTGNHQSGKDLLNKLVLLADFGVRSMDPLAQQFFKRVVQNQREDGALLGHVVMPMKKSAEWLFDIDGQDPLLALVSMGFGNETTVLKAVDYLANLSLPSGGWIWPQAKSPLPCRKPEGGCPYPTLKILRILAHCPKWFDSKVTRSGVALLLSLWEERERSGRYGFGMGGRFRKLKYPFIWFDVLHVLEALSPYPWVWKTEAFGELLEIVVSKSDEEGRFTPESVWMEWKNLTFGQKKEPSAWLTLVIHRILARNPDLKVRKS
ncbi:MAG TPA: hypothetical protein VL126_13185 [Bacteroidota bacterium]|nr:hypothetical protein [Bacteroidota bacterium]